MLLNFHTHQADANPDEIRVMNVHVPENLMEDEQQTWLESLPKEPISLGIHPWYCTEESIDNQLQWLEKVALLSNVRMIGECGLDRLCSTPYQVQEKVFLTQIRLAESLKKPMVLHIVRCFSELLSIQKIIRPSVSMVVHGFNNKARIAEALLQKGFYFSFGVALLQENSKALEVMKQTPINRFFLENDDKNIEIEQLYAIVSKHKNTSIENLSEQLLENYYTL